MIRINLGMLYIRHETRYTRINHRLDRKEIIDALEEVGDMSMHLGLAFTKSAGFALSHGFEVYSLCTTINAIAPAFSKRFALRATVDEPRIAMATWPATADALSAEIFLAPFALLSSKKSAASTPSSGR